MSTQTALKQNCSVILKGGLFTLTALQLLNHDLDAIGVELDNKIQQAPNFFKNAPVVLDVQALQDSEAEVNFAAILQVLRRKKLIPVGVRGATEVMRADAVRVGLAILSESKSEAKNTATKELPATKAQQQAASNVQAVAAAPAAPNQSTPSRIINQPIRSGQQIYVPGGDLIVMAPVSHGAELLADGHIHVHGPLRGRALAGINGDQSAMIYCQSLEAELVSVAGEYKISEDLKEILWKQPAHITFNDGRLHVTGLK